MARGVLGEAAGAVVDDGREGSIKAYPGGGNRQADRLPQRADKRRGVRTELISACEPVHVVVGQKTRGGPGNLFVTDRAV
jgi:hypothetical protein